MLHHWFRFGYALSHGAVVAVGETVGLPCVDSLTFDVFALVMVFPGQLISGFKSGASVSPARMIGSRASVVVEGGGYGCPGGLHHCVVL